VVGTYVCRDIVDIAVVRHASTCTGTHLPFPYNPRRLLCASRKCDGDDDVDGGGERKFI
jgi:hypothetical protein